jgi:Transcriptional regulator/sugar kinase
MTYAGIDIGGSAVKAALVDEKGALLCKTSFPTGVGRPYRDIIRDIADAVASLASQQGVSMKDIAGAGIGLPGVASNGLVILHNLYWFDVPVAEEFNKHIDIPVTIDNDATAAALYEYRLGALAGCSVGVLLTLGTGVGGGIIIGGKPFSGAHGLGSELGHLAVVPHGLQCTCGNKGCLEVYGSAGAFVRLGRRCVIERPESMLHHVTGGDYMKVTPQLIFETAKGGDYVAEAIIDEYVSYLAMGVCTIENFIDPDVIAFGGGISGAGDYLLQKLIRASEGLGIFENKQYAEIRLAKAGNDAGVIGAALLAMV